MQTPNTRIPTAAQARQARQDEIIYGLPSEYRSDLSFADERLITWAGEVVAFYYSVFKPLDPEHFEDNEPYQRLIDIGDELSCRRKSHRLELIAAGLALLEEVTPEILARVRKINRNPEWRLKELLRGAQYVCTAALAEGLMGR